MPKDRTFALTLILSICIHAAVVAMFTFVIVVDLGSVPSLAELTYVGHAATKDGIESVVTPLGMNLAPTIDLPSRAFAEESIASSTGEEEIPLPVHAEPVDMIRNYRVAPSEHIKLDISVSSNGARRPLRLAVDDRVSIEGDLAGRRLLIGPAGPDYPEWVLKSGREIGMKMRITVSPGGMVQTVENVESSGYPRIDLMASEYVRQWRFEKKPDIFRDESGVISIKFRLK